MLSSELRTYDDMNRQIFMRLAFHTFSICGDSAHAM